jgi:hypothetical protein
VIINNLIDVIIYSIYLFRYATFVYLYKFDKQILDNIENNTNYVFDRDKRELWLPNKQNPVLIHDINWVTNQKKVNRNIIKKIDSQFIIIKKKTPIIHTYFE